MAMTTMWSDERAELRRELTELTITAVQWIAVWFGMMALLIKVIFQEGERNGRRKQEHGVVRGTDIDNPG